MEDFIQNRFGYCFYEVIGDTALVYNLFVHPEYRHQGQARKLLRYVIKEIREEFGYLGDIFVEAISKEEAVDDERLVAFYKKEGLRILSEKEGSKMAKDKLNVIGGPDRKALHKDNVTAVNFSETDPFWDIGVFCDNLCKEIRRGEVEDVLIVVRREGGYRHYWRGISPMSSIIGATHLALHDMIDNER